MATKRGSHQRPVDQQGLDQQASNQQSSGRKPSAAQEAYERAYRSYVNQQRAAQGGQYAQPANRAGYQQDAYQQQAGGRPQGYAQYGNAGYAQQPPKGWQPVQKKKGHPVRNTLLVILFILFVVGGVGGFTGYTLYNSAKVVKADASAVMKDLSDLKSQVTSDDPSQANATAADISKHAKAMKEETGGWAWTVASYVPVYGEDVAMVKELSDILVDLSDNAVVPLMGEVSQMSLKTIFADGAINVDYSKKLVAAVDNAAPVINRCATKMEAMGDAHLEQVNEPLQKAKSYLDKLDTMAQFVKGIAPTFADMIGADGRARNYLVVACQPAEIRATGGFLGSLGVLTIDNGRIEMGDFIGIAEIYPDDNTPEYEITQEEGVIFGGHVTAFLGNTSFIPDWARVSQIITYYWEAAGNGSVDGMIGVDPVFLQHLLGLTGSVTTSTGVTVDGSNAGQLLGHDMYYMTGKEQDAFYGEVAALAFQQILGNLGSVPLTTFASQVQKDMKARRLQVWMANEDEEAAMELLGADGKLPTDPSQPKLGVYINDDSWSKMFWYLKVNTDIGTGEKQPDGSTVYHAKTSYSNMLEPGGEWQLSSSMDVHNIKLSRTNGDMIAWVMLSAPAGGSITNMQADGYFTPYDKIVQDRGIDYPGGMVSAPYNGVEMWYGLGQILPGESITLTYDVTVPASATEPLEVITTPNYQEVAGW